MSSDRIAPLFLHLNPGPGGLEYLELTLASKQDEHIPNKTWSLLATTTRNPKRGPLIDRWDLVLRTTTKRGKQVDYPVEFFILSTEIGVLVECPDSSNLSFKNSLEAIAATLAEQRWRTLLLLEIRSLIKQKADFVHQMHVIYGDNNQRNYTSDTAREIAFAKAKLQAAATLSRQELEVAFDLIATLEASGAPASALNLPDILQATRSALLH